MRLKLLSQLLLSREVAFHGKNELDPKRRALILLQEAAAIAQAAGVSKDMAELVIGGEYLGPTSDDQYENTGSALVAILMHCAALDYDPEEALNAEIRRTMMVDQ